MYLFVNATGAKQNRGASHFNPKAKSLFKKKDQMKSIGLASCDLGVDGAKAVADYVSGSKAMDTITLDGNYPGFPLPVKQLKGTEPVETLNLSRKKLGFLSGIVIAKLIKVNGVLTSSAS